MEKYGFVYIWYDRKRKMYYIGSHWGTEDDGYICSSNRMRDAYRRRPQDFKRKIIQKIYTNRYDLLEQEELLLSKIKNEEIGLKYYNLIKIAKHIYHGNEEKRKSAYQKISEHHKNNPNWGSWGKGKKQTEETKQLLREANRKQFENPNQIEIRKQKSKELWQNPEYLEKQKTARNKPRYYKGFTGKHTEETKQKIKNKKLGISVHNEETREKLRQITKSKIWVNNGTINKRVEKHNIPDGFVRGKHGQ
jgi:hypothetical protein